MSAKCHINTSNTQDRKNCLLNYRALYEKAIKENVNYIAIIVVFHLLLFTLICFWFRSHQNLIVNKGQIRSDRISMEKLTEVKMYPVYLNKCYACITSCLVCQWISECTISRFHMRQYINWIKEINYSVSMTLSSSRSKSKSCNVGCACSISDLIHSKVFVPDSLSIFNCNQSIDCPLLQGCLSSR